MNKNLLLLLAVPGYYRLTGGYTACFAARAGLSVIPRISSRVRPPQWSGLELDLLQANIERNNFGEGRVCMLSPALFF